MSPRTARGALTALLLLSSAVLIRLSVPPFDLAPLMLVAWCPFLAVMRESPWRWALALGFSHGFGLGLAAHAWIPQALASNLNAPTWQAWGALIAVAASVGARCALVGAAVSLASARRSPMWVYFPIFQVCAELAIPGFFPWTTALATHAVPLWAQLARWGGAAAISLWICLFNALVLEAFVVFRRHRDWVSTGRLVLAAVLTLLLVGGYGKWSLSSEAARRQVAPRLRVAIGHYVSTSAVSDAIPTLRDLAIARQMRGDDFDFLVWPESASPEPLRLAQAGALARDYWRRDRRRPPSLPRLQALLLLGVAVEHDGGLENSALMVDATGRVLGRYVKRSLLPVGETGLPLPGSLGRSAFSFRAGSEAPAVAVNGHPLAISICFEDILAEAVRSEVVRTDAELLVNLTSDRWFKDTSAVDFHFALAKLRAVEHGKYLVRSTRDGISAVVDSSGQTVVQAERQRSTIVSVDVPLLSGLSPYSWLSPWFHAACWAAAAVLLLRLAAMRAPS
jgi:apolipoprotein N-acyltransferase